jgi:hypothetical protein
MDPFSGAVALVVGLIRTHRLNEWARLCFAMLWSYWTAFSFAMGTALVAAQPLPVALGSGMLTGAGAACFLFLRSPLTKGLMIAVPKELLLQDARATSLATVRRDK